METLIIYDNYTTDDKILYGWGLVLKYSNKYYKEWYNHFH